MIHLRANFNDQLKLTQTIEHNELTVTNSESRPNV